MGVRVGVRVRVRVGVRERVGMRVGRWVRIRQGCHKSLFSAVRMGYYSELTVMAVSTAAWTFMVKLYSLLIT